VIGFIRVQANFHRACGHGKRLPPSRRLDRLEIDPLYCPRTDEGFDFPDDFRLEGDFEAPFLAASFEAAAS
jgi:hypothetical protein